MNESGSDSLVPVATGYGFPEAAVAVSFLRAYGIHAAPLYSHHVSVEWNLTIALGGMHICVPRSQQETAIALLASVDDRNEGLSRPFAWHAGFVCIALALLLILGFPLPVPARGFFIGGSQLHHDRAAAAS